jgi:predicted transcriptional regulator
MQKRTRRRTNADNKIFRAFRLHPRLSRTLNRTAARLHRTNTSVIEQLISQYCTTKNLQP